VDLGITLLPVGHSGEVALIIHEISLADSIQSPGTSFRQAMNPKADVQLQLLLSTPGLGRPKAQKLLKAYGSVQSVAFASVQDLSSHVGVKSAALVHKYFNGFVST